jgi:hypothetical protein
MAVTTLPLSMAQFGASSLAPFLNLKGMLSERSQTAEAIHRLKEEIDKLTNQQTEALKTATYLGMTTDEVKEYEQRREKILEYVNDLKILEESL